MTISLAQLLHAAQVHTHPEAADIAISGLTLDSRQVKPGDVFCAIQGSVEHGQKYAEQAIARGAVAILLHAESAPENKTVPYYCNAQLPEHLGAIAKQFFFANNAGQRQSAPPVIGVTGTNGKTSSVQLLAQLFGALGLPCGTIGTLGVGFPNALIEGARTTPDAIAVQQELKNLLDAGAHWVAMEASSHALDQHRVNAVDFRLAVFTNLTRDHLDYHGDMERYYLAKKRLFQMPSLSAALINADDPYGARLIYELAQERPQLRIVSFGTNSSALIQADRVELSDAGIAFDLLVGEQRTRISAPLVGRFNVLNLLGVIACAIEQGFSAAHIARACLALTPVRGRMNKLGGSGADGKRQALIVIDYAHTPDALEQALQAAGAHVLGASAAQREAQAHAPLSMQRGSLICVFGCGGDRDPGKRPQMGEIAARLADHVIITSDNPRSEEPNKIIAQIMQGSQISKAKARQIDVQPDRALAIAQAIHLAKPGDVVLIAGKGHENYQEINGQKFDFDDLEQARLALEAA